jgi:hypothetical protein
MLYDTISWRNKMIDIIFIIVENQNYFKTFQGRISQNQTQIELKQQI